MIIHKRTMYEIVAVKLDYKTAILDFWFHRKGILLL